VGIGAIEVQEFSFGFSETFDVFGADVEVTIKLGTVSTRRIRRRLTFFLKSYTAIRVGCGRI